MTTTRSPNRKKQMKSKLLAAFAVMVATLALFASTASAHSYDITASCQGGLYVSLTGYNHNSHNVDVWVDNQHLVNTTFKSSFGYAKSFDKTKPHTWHVVVVAPGEKSPDLSGKVAACQEETTTTTVAPTTTTEAPTTTVAVTTTTVEAIVVPAPTTTGQAIPCVQDANGNWNWQGTPNPCQGPPRVPVTPTAALPATGIRSAAAILIGSILLGIGAAMAFIARRKTRA